MNITRPNFNSLLKEMATLVGYFLSISCGELEYVPNSGHIRIYWPLPTASRTELQDRNMMLLSGFLSYSLTS